MKFLYLIVLFVALVTFEIDAKVFGRCELAQKLKASKIAVSKIPTWVCIAKWESDYNTAAWNHQSGDHGIFQISQIYWCNNSNTPGKGCHATCSQFRNDNIDDDIACVKKIYNEHQRLSGNGFNAWVAYKKHCTGNQSSYIKGCNI